MFVINKIVSFFYKKYFFIKNSFALNKNILILLRLWMDVKCILLYFLLARRHVKYHDIAWYQTKKISYETCRNNLQLWVLYHYNVIYSSDFSDRMCKRKRTGDCFSWYGLCCTNIDGGVCLGFWRENNI